MPAAPSEGIKCWRQYYDPIANYLRSRYPDGEGTVWKRDLRKVSYDGTDISVTERYDAPDLNCLDKILRPGHTVNIKESYAVAFTGAPLSFTVLEAGCDWFVVANPESYDPSDSSLGEIELTHLAHGLLSPN